MSASRVGVRYEEIVEGRPNKHTQSLSTQSTSSLYK